MSSDFNAYLCTGNKKRSIHLSLPRGEGFCPDKQVFPLEDSEGAYLLTYQFQAL